MRAGRAGGRPQKEETHEGIRIRFVQVQRLLRLPAACKDEHWNNEWLPYALPQPDTGHFWCKVTQTDHGQVPKVRVEYTPRFCNHCDEAPCMQAAPEAVYKREDGRSSWTP